MNYISSNLSVPYAKCFHDLGKTGIVEWETEAIGNPINEAFLKELEKGKAGNKRIFTPINENGSFFNQNDYLEPALFIFHTSRCGSSYAANYFATNPENRVYNEPHLLSHFFNKHSENNQKDKEKLAQAINLLGCGALPSQKRLIIKLTSNSIKKIEQFHSLFPSVPKLFLYRDPREVLVSLEKGPPIFLIKHKKNKKVLINASIQYLEEIFTIAKENKKVFSQCIKYDKLKSQLVTWELEKGWSLESTYREEQLKLIDKKNSKVFTQDFQEDITSKQKEWNNINRKFELSIDNLDRVVQQFEATTN